eukprot:jgi/Ulvmu1/2683/UM014_0139.1
MSAQTGPSDGHEPIIADMVWSHAARYLDPLEVERIELHAFGSKAMVTSFRTAKLEGWVVDELERIADEKAKANEKSQNELDSDDQGLIKAQTMGDITDEDHRQV